MMQQWNKCGNKANQYRKILGKRMREHKDWIAAETLEKVAERKQRKAKINNSKTSGAKTEAHRLYTEANKEVKRSVKRDKKDFVERLAGQAEEAAGQRNLKELYDITRKLASTCRKDEQQVMDKTGQVTNQADQLNRWKEYFEVLLNQPSPDEPPEIPPAETPLRITTDRPSKQEIRKAILQLKNGKAPGSSEGIPPESIKVDIETSVDCLYRLFGKIWVQEEILEDWRHGHLFKLPKKGNLKDYKNWRGITLLSIPGKVFNRILLERMKTEVNRLLWEEQAGCGKERSCTDHIAILRVITEQSLEWNSPLYITFIDF